MQSISTSAVYVLIHSIDALRALFVLDMYIVVGRGPGILVAQLIRCGGDGNVGKRKMRAAGVPQGVGGCAAQVRFPFRVDLASKGRGVVKIALQFLVQMIGADAGSGR